jgi:DNA-binding transcriptional LysR family regulator
MIGFAAERLMELEVGALTGAAYGEKSAYPESRRHQPKIRAFRDWLLDEIADKPATAEPAATP